MSEEHRKCLKCGSSPAQDPGTTLYRFPNPSKNISLLCELWAKYCFPDRECSSRTFQQKLYDEHRMLCHKHFEQASFIDYSQKKLHKHASPSDEHDMATPVSKAETVLQEHNYAAPPAVTDSNTAPGAGARGDGRPIHNAEGPAAISCNEVCRICLAADKKMFVLDTKHKKIYKSVTGITVQPIDRLPKLICWECKHFIAKYYTFKMKAVTSHCILTEVLTTHKTFTTLEKHQPESTLTCTGIWYSNLDGVDHEEIADEDATKIKNEADLIWEDEINFTSFDNGEINVISDNKPIDYINEDANFTTKDTRGETLCTGIWYTNLEGVDHEESDDEDVTKIKNEADLWEEEIILTCCDSGEINVISDNKPIDYINEDANFTTKDTRGETFNIEITQESVKNISSIEIPEQIVRNENEIKVKEKTVKNLHNIEFPEHKVKNDTTEKTVEKLNNNENLDILFGDYTDDDENEFWESNGSDEISSKSIKNISSEHIDVTKKFMKKLELDKTLRTVTTLSKEEQIAEMKKKEENYNSLNRQVHPKLPAAGPHCERCDLRFASQEAFDVHKTCSTNLADKRTTKITPRLAEPMVVNGIQFAKSLRVELRKYYAPPGYPPLFGAPLKKPKADSLKVKNSSKTSNEAVYSDANIAELSKRTKRLEEAKEKANCTETVVGDKNNSLVETCEDKFICDECGQQFTKKDYIILHMKTKHVKDIYIRFQKYAYSSVAKDRLEKHSKLNCEKRKIFGDERNKRFISKNILKRHKQGCGIKNTVSNTHSALEPYLCTKCGIRFILIHDFIRHMRTHTGEKPYSSKQFSRNSELNIQMRTHTGEKPYSCTVCKKQFSQRGHLDTHMGTHTGAKPYSCTVCKKQFSQRGHLTIHMRIHTGEKPYLCSVCSKQFNRNNDLNKHMRTHTGEKPYSCTVCKKLFGHISSLNTHMRTHTGENPYSCTVCKKQFSQRGHLDTHMGTHTGAKPYSFKQFSRNSDLNIQMRTHTGAKLYSCTVCKKQFSQRGHLDTHMGTHTGAKPYSCTVCKKQFGQTGHLNTHMRIHTGEKPYLCTVCSKKFNRNSDLNKHMRTHTGEKPYSCTVCKKQFSHNSSLNIHLRTHTGENPYTCTVCKKQFKQSCHLDRHMRTHTGAKPFSCTVCSKQFSRNYDCNKHMRTHIGAKPYSCTVCKKHFTQNCSLNTHMRTHTG